MIVDPEFKSSTKLYNSWIDLLSLCGDMGSVSVFKGQSKVSAGEIFQGFNRAEVTSRTSIG